MNRLVWPALIFLVLVGVSASVMRVLAPTFTNDVAIPTRAQAMASMGVVDPRAAERLADVDRFERKFAERRSTIGFGTTSLLAEYWILHTRPRARVARVPTNVLA